MTASTRSAVGGEAYAARPLVAVGWMALSGLLFVCVTAIVRHVGSDLPAVEGAFLRYVVGLLLVLPALLQVLRRLPPRPVLILYGWRGLIHGGAVMLWFYAMARIPIAEVTAIGYTAPIFVTIGAALFLGEKLRLHRLVAIAAGFLGALVILRPGFHEINLGQLAQLCAAPLFAASFLLAKRLTRDQSPTAIVAMLTLTVTLALLPGAIAQWREPSMMEVFWMSLTAVFATAGHYAQTRAYQAAPITVTQPVGFLQIVWATLLGLVAFGEPVDPFVILGAAIVVGAASYISHREARIYRAAITPPVTATKL